MISFVSLSLLLSIRAQITCYTDPVCGLANAINGIPLIALASPTGISPTEVSTARECCLQGLPETGSYFPTGGSLAACETCIGNWQALIPIDFTCRVSASCKSGLKASGYNAASIFFVRMYVRGELRLCGVPRPSAHHRLTTVGYELLGEPEGRNT